MRRNEEGRRRIGWQQHMGSLFLPLYFSVSPNSWEEEEEDVCYGIRRAAAFVDWSDHHTLAGSGEGQIACEESGREKRAREEEWAGGVTAPQPSMLRLNLSTLPLWPQPGLVPFLLGEFPLTSFQCACQRLEFSKLKSTIVGCRSSAFSHFKPDASEREREREMTRERESERARER